MVDSETLEYIGSFIVLLLVGMLWGCTNPLIKKASAGIEKVNAPNVFLQFFYEIQFLLKNLKYLVPLVLNQAGSLLYFLALAKTEWFTTTTVLMCFWWGGMEHLSLSVPVANSLTFVFTALTGIAIGEETPNKGTCIGVACVICGIILCVIDKMPGKTIKVALS